MRVTAILERWTVRCVLLSVISAGVVFSPARLSSSASAMQAVGILNAASFASDGLVTPNTIVAAFGQFKTLNNGVYPAQSVPLPTTLGQVSVKVNGIAAGLLIVTPLQINLVIPGTVAVGAATLVVTNSDGTTLSGMCTVVASQPGIFTATSNGLGVAAGQTTFDGIAYQFISNPDGSAIPINPGTKERPNFLILYTTGLGTIQLGQVKVTFLGVPGRVDYAGPQGAFVGLDQINIRIPWELAGLGTVRVVVTITIGNEVVTANPVTINFGGTIPPILAFPITPGSTVNGELSYDDQIQTSGDNVYFFDAYVFQTTAANVSVSLDLRSPRTSASTSQTSSASQVAFDCLVLLYKLENNQLTLVAQNDQTGGIGDGEVDVNNNALLLTVLATPGTYVALMTTYDGAPLTIGSYTLEFKANVIQQINYGQSVMGNIAVGDVQTSVGVYLDAYWFNAVQGDRIEATLRSTAFDAFVLLYPNYTDPELKFDDNGFGPAPNLDSKLTYTIMESGKHLLFATPFAINVTGAYTITLNKVASFTPTEATETDRSPSIPGRLVRPSEDRRRLTAPHLPQGTSFDRAAQRRFVIR